MSWYGIDLDGTLAKAAPTFSPFNPEIGPPIPAMVSRVREWVRKGRDVRIFTARATPDLREIHIPHIERWCLEHIGYILPITCYKDYDTAEIWDDRAIQVVTNTGMTIEEINAG